MIFFESETLVLSDATEKSITGVHTWVFQQVKIKRTKRWLDGTWRQEGAERALKAGGTHTTRTYIDKRQVIVAHWVDLRTIFEVCMQEEARYASAGRRRALWWRQMAADTQLRAKL